MAQKLPADLALDEDEVGTRFVMLVVIMMTTLATLAMGGALVVHALRSSWVGAVSGHMTIEIPAVGVDGTVREPDALMVIANQMRDVLAKDDEIKSVHVLPRADVEKLVKPWLGNDAGSADLPLPALIGVMLKHPGDTAEQNKIADAVKAVDARASSETHQAWLSDLKRFSFVLLLAALAMAAATIACSILTVTGAVKARLAAHHGDIDLLHVMGATDDYVGGQFVRLVVSSVGRAAVIGTVAGLIFLKIGGLIAGELQSAMLPAFHWNFTALLWFAVCPALVTALSFMAARFTVLRTLAVMP
jgi:cell division transport system permease protein